MPLDLIPVEDESLDLTPVDEELDLTPVEPETGTIKGIVSTAKLGYLSTAQAQDAQRLAATAKGPTIRQEREAFVRAMEDPRYMDLLSRRPHDINHFTEGTVESPRPRDPNNLAHLVGPEAKLQDMRAGKDYDRQQIANRMAERERKMQDIKLAPGYQAYAEAEGKDAVTAFMANPFEVTANIVAQGLGSSTPALIGAAVGGITAGPVGTAIGAGQGSFRVEYAHAILDSLRQEGVDVTDPDELLKAFKDPDKLNAAKKHGIKRGVPISVLDAFAGGVAGKFLLGATGPASAAKRGAAEASMQAALGGSGETLAQLASEGKVSDLKGIFEEAIGELGPGAVEAALNVTRARLKESAEDRAAVASAVESGALDLTPVTEPTDQAEATEAPEMGLVTEDGRQVMTLEELQRRFGSAFGGPVTERVPELEEVVSGDEPKTSAKLDDRGEAIAVDDEPSIDFVASAEQEASLPLGEPETTVQQKVGLEQEQERRKTEARTENEFDDQRLKATNTQGEIGQGDLFSAPTTPPIAKEETNDTSEVSAAKAKVRDTFNDLFKLGVIADPNRDAERAYAFYRALFNLARVYAKQGVKSASEFAKRLGVRLNGVIDRAWKDAAANKITPQSQFPAELTTELAAGARERKFSVRFNEDDRISQEIRQATGNRTYQRIPNAVTVSQAMALVESLGLDAAIVEMQNRANNLDYRSRVAMGEAIIMKANREYSATQDPTMQDRAVQTAEWLTEEGTMLGQGVQAFAIWSRLTPEGYVTTYKRAIKRQDRKNRRRGADAADDLQDITEAEAPGVVDAVKPTVKRAARRRKQRVAAVKDHGSLWARYRAQSVASLKKRLTSAKDLPRVPGLVEFTRRMTAHLRAKLPEKKAQRLAKMTPLQQLREAVTNRTKYREVWERTKAELQNEFSDNESVLDALDEFFGSTFETPFSPRTIPRMVQEAIKADGIDIQRLILKHYTEVNEVRDNLADRLVREAGLSPGDAIALAREVKAEFERRTARAKRALIARLNAKTSKGNKIHRSEAMKVIELSNAGALNKSEAADGIARAFGLPNISTEEARRIHSMAQSALEKPNGFPRQEAMIDVLAHIARLKGITPWEVATAVWYAYILSGWTTQALNILATIFNLLAEATVHGANRPGDIPSILAGLFNGMIRGAFDAAALLRTGKVTGTRIKKFEPSQVLEMVDYKGAKNLISVWKHVGRFMAASDMVWFRSAEEMKARLLARTLARDEGLSGSELRSRMAAILHNTDDALAKAEDQATREGFKRNGTRAERIDWRRRVYEIMEQARPEALVEEASDYGRFATFNQEPTGLAGVIARGIGAMVKSFPPLVLLVPFTHVVANVTNNGLNFTPWGYKRLFDKFNLNDERSPDFGTEEWRIQFGRATLATLGLTGLMALVLAYKDDEEPLVDITAKGPSDSTRRNQLKEKGWRAYHITINGVGFNYQGTPMHLGLSILGNWMDGIRYKDIEELDAANRVWFALHQVPKSVLDQSFLSGLSDFFESMSRDSINRSKQSQFTGLSRTVSSTMVPNIVKQIDRLFDPTIYDASTVRAALLRDIPIARSFLGKPMLNALGEAVMADLNPFMTTDTDDDLWLALGRRQLYVPVPERTTLIFGEPIEPEDYYNWLEASGPMIRAKLEMNLPKLMIYDQERAQKEINSIVREERDRAKRLLFGPMATR